MFTKSKKLIPVQAAFLVCAISADSQILQVELELLIRECKFEEFKSRYQALEAEFKSIKERSASFASFERVAQEIKQEKLAEFAVVLKRSIHGYWPFAKMMLQGSGAALMMLVTAEAIPRYFLKSCDRSDLYGGGICFIIALSCAYYAKKNYTQAFHQDVVIKGDIDELDKIIAFIASREEITVTIENGVASSGQGVLSPELVQEILDFRLFVAVDRGDIEEAKRLIDAKADVNRQDLNLYTGLYTPLHLAVINNDIDMVNLLIAANADKNIRDDFGKTAFDYAKSQEIKELLRRK